MSRAPGAPVTPYTLGRGVLGPIVAEFCLRLWSTAALHERPDDTALLFCARGGLRLQLAYERFLTAAALRSPVGSAPLMVSRVVAARPALLRTPVEGLDALVPAAATALSYEFAVESTGTAVRALTGVDPEVLGATANGPVADEPFDAARFAALLRSAQGRDLVASLREQSTLFRAHLDAALDGRRRAVLVDTGLYGTTAHLLAAGAPDLAVGSALIARSYRPSRGSTTGIGLCLQASEYSPLRRRSALLRYWHLVEWLFEPDLPSVTRFEADADGVARANLEIDGWRDRLAPDPGSAFAGVLDHLDELPPAPGARVVVEADVAWRRLHRLVAFPRPDEGRALDVGTRSFGFGLDVAFAARSWRGPVAALRGSTMWREGEIARARTPLRAPLLAAIEAGYTARSVRRGAVRTLRGRREDTS